MSDNPNTVPQGHSVEPEATPTPAPSSPPAEAQNTVPDEQRIPKARFDAVNQERNELRAKLEKLEQAEEQRKLAAMSDLERAQKEKDDAAAKATQLEAQLEQERQERLSDRRKNLVAHALTLAQAVDADETVEWLAKHAPDELAQVLGKDDMADPDQIKALVDKAKAERAHHFRPGGPGSPSNRGGEIPQVHITEKAAAMAEAAREHGYDLDKKRLNDRVAQHEDEQAIRNEGR
jgi:hypothetical protein